MDRTRIIIRGGVPNAAHIENLLELFLAETVLKPPSEVRGVSVSDVVVDPQSRQLIGNPAHGGEHVYEIY